MRNICYTAVCICPSTWLDVAPDHSVLIECVMVILLSSMTSGELLLKVTLLFLHRVVLLHILVFHFWLSCNILSTRHLVVFGKIVILLSTIPVGFFSVAKPNDLHFLCLSGEFDVDLAQVLRLLNVEHPFGA